MDLKILRRRMTQRLKDIFKQRELTNAIRSRTLSSGTCYPRWNRQETYTGDDGTP